MFRGLACLMIAASALAAPAAKTSRYLIEHGDDAVAWRPWGDAAFAEAKREQKPIYLSIGYASCHWCHVMQRESFRNAEIAKRINAGFVPVLVDREEHPEIDATYQAFVQAMAGEGGWPANLVLTPDLHPVIGATYLKPEALGKLLDAIANRWTHERQALLESSQQLVAMVRSLGEKPAAGAAAAPQAATLDRAWQEIRATYDVEHGGFGSAPKFPNATTLDFLLRYAVRNDSAGARDVATKTLKAMAAGPIHDQIGGGFHRYTVDAAWREPHYEKMLIDQALLAGVYTEAWQMTRDPQFEAVARDTCDYVLREMRDPGGGFWSGQDADSIVPGKTGPELVEGRFYHWDPERVVQILGRKRADIAMYYYGLDAPLPHLAHSEAMTRAKFGLSERELADTLTAIRERMLDVRSKRPRPFADDKVLAGWNGLMISALARAGSALDDAHYVAKATDAARFIRTKMWDAKSKKLLRRARGGQAGLDALAEDYAYVIAGLVDLYEASFDIRWLDFAVELQQRQDALFWDEATNRYAIASTAPVAGVGTESDASSPSPNAVSAMNLLRLGELTDSAPWRAKSGAILRSFAARLETAPSELPQMASAVALSLDTAKQIVIAGDPTRDDTREMLRIVRERFIPNRLLLLADGTIAQKRLAAYVPVIAEMRPDGDKARAFVCEHFVCKLPTTDPRQLAKSLE